MLYLMYKFKHLTIRSEELTVNKSFNYSFFNVTEREQKKNKRELLICRESLLTYSVALLFYFKTKRKF